MERCHPPVDQAGQVHKEYARRDDQFHQAESDI